MTKLKNMTRIDLTTSEKFTDYELLDSGLGHKLERFGEYIVSRPESQAVWDISNPSLWRQAYAVFEAGKDGLKGGWKIAEGGGKNKKESWQVFFRDIKFKVKPTPFRHLGVFPEQSPHWEFAEKKIEEAKKEKRELKVLNLFGYTGAASIVCAKAGAFVTHVDASGQSIEWAKENQKINGLPDNSIRWIKDDALKFVKREIKRGNKYDGIIVDPPKFGRGANGEVWKLDEGVLELVRACVELLSDDKSFLIVTAYATDLSAVSLANLLVSACPKRDDFVEYGELKSKEFSVRGFELSHAIFVRC